MVVLFSPGMYDNTTNISSFNILLMCGKKINKEKLNYKLSNIVNQYGGYINGGFIAGKTENILNKFTKFKSKIETFEWPNIRGSNQAFLNYSFDLENDSGSYHLYNAIPIKK